MCHDCTKTFSEPTHLDQHKQDTGHKITPTNAKKNYIDKFMKERKVHVDQNDKKASVETFKNVMEPLLKHVSQQDGGEVFSSNYRMAGSHAAKSKIRKADEFDTNIPMNVEVTCIKTKGSLPYIYEDKIQPPKDGHSASNLNVPRVLMDNPSGKIEKGRAMVRVNPVTAPEHLLHNGDHLIPHKVQEDLYRKVDTALKDLNMKDVHLSREAHGPAITLTIKQPMGHDISVDITPTLPCDVPVTRNGWPRPATKKAFSPDTIQKVKDTGMHLVPKGGEMWTASYSKAETALQANFDQGNGCRRNVLKFCKRQTEMCASGEGKGLPGVSSHILKNAVLWSCENHPGDEYWHQRNVDRCTIDTLRDTEGYLRSGNLPNYFNDRENILKGKDPAVLDRLADHFQQERMRLENM